MLSSHAIVINVKRECENTSSTDVYSCSSWSGRSGKSSLDKCNDTHQHVSSLPLTSTFIASSSTQTQRAIHNDNSEQSIAFKRLSTSTDYTLNLINLMGLEMPPVRRKGYAGANYSVKGNNLQTSGSLPNLHQHVSVRGSISNTSAPSSSSHRNHSRSNADYSLQTRDDSSDSGVSSRSPTPNNNFLASAGAAGDQGPPDEHFIKKTIKEVKQVTSTSNNSNCSPKVSSSSISHQHHSHHHHHPHPHSYQQQHHHTGSNYHIHHQLTSNHHQGHRGNNVSYNHRNNFLINSNNNLSNNSNNNNFGNNSNSNSGGGGGADSTKRKFHHSSRHCSPIQAAGAASAGRGGRIVSGLFVHVPPPPSLSPVSPAIINHGGGNSNNPLSPTIVYPTSTTTPPDRFLSKSHLVQVTKTPSQLTNGSHWDELSKAVWNKFLTNQQTLETYRKKLTLWKCLYLYIKALFPKYSLFLVGSTMSGFGSNTSDVDMCLIVRRQEMDQRSEALLHLTNLLYHLHHLDCIEKLDLVQAKVPILKFRERNQGIDVDLNCNNAVGIRNTHLLACYAKLDWRVRPLVLVVKLWAQWHDINDAKNMTISSYSLALMVIHFLQCGVNPPVLPCLNVLYQSKFSPHRDISSIDIHEEIPFQSENIQPLGELLLQFFSYYDSFDYSMYAVSVRLAGRIPIEECRRVRTIKNEPHQWKYLCIEEPFDQTNTARSVYDLEAFERIRLIIHETYCSLNTTHSLDSIFRLEPSSHHHVVSVPLHHNHQHHHNHLQRHHRTANNPGGLGHHLIGHHQQYSAGTSWTTHHRLQNSIPSTQQLPMATSEQSQTSLHSHSNSHMSQSTAALSPSQSQTQTHAQSFFL